MNSKKYWQVIETYGSDTGATSKAHSDVADIAAKLGFETVIVQAPKHTDNILYKIRNKILYAIRLLKIKRYFQEKSVVLLQLPFLNLAAFSHNYILKKCKRHNVKIMAVIHDINSLRSSNNNLAFNNFFEILNYASVVISHNESMSQYLQNMGIDKDKLVNLEVFDYLLNNEHKQETLFSKEVSIAGNLASDKSKYLEKLPELKSVNFNLYGPNYSQVNNYNNIKYHGVFKPNELTDVLDRGFGLVWDGISLNTCDGLYGNYLRYNNPHKLSLYIASGLPIIVWSESAEAEFVIKNKIGIAVSSLYELEDKLGQIDEDAYSELLSSLKIVQNKVINGYYAREAITKAVRLLE